MTKRSYRQNCALALASDLVGERWSLLMIRDLLTGPKRYNELSQSLQGMGTNLLASRLKQLEAAGIVGKTAVDTGGHAYALTEMGRALEPAVLALARWGLTYLPGKVEGYYHQDDWDLVALKAAFEPGRATGLTVRTQFTTDKFSAWVDIRNQKMNIGLGVLDKPDITIEGTIEDFFVAAKEPAALMTSGSRKRLDQFISSFAI